MGDVLPFKRRDRDDRVVLNELADYVGGNELALIVLDAETGEASVALMLPKSGNTHGISITPHQARQLAVALIEFAAEVEADR